MVKHAFVNLSSNRRRKLSRSVIIFESLALTAMRKNIPILCSRQRSGNASHTARDAIRAHRQSPTGRLNILDSYATWNATPKLTLAAEGDYVIERLFTTSAPSHTGGGAAYVRYQLAPKVALAGQNEYMADIVRVMGTPLPTGDALEEEFGDPPQSARKRLIIVVSAITRKGFRHIPWPPDIWESRPHPGTGTSEVDL